MDSDSTLHVTYGDVIGDALQASAPTAHVLVYREALRHGPLPADGALERFTAERATFLAQAHDADRAQVVAELDAAWETMLNHDGAVVLHVDAEPCEDCAAFASAVVDALEREGSSRHRTIVSGETRTILDAEATRHQCEYWRDLVAQRARP